MGAEIKVIACEVMKEELLSVRTSSSHDIHFVTMGLHKHPARLHDELQRLVDATDGYQRIVFTFGLCGGALRGLKAASCPLFFPRVHDCIPIFMGSGIENKALRENSKGTFYLSGGWLECGESVTSEYDRVKAKYGEMKAQKIYKAMYDSYRQVLFIHTNHPRKADCLKKSKEIALLLGLEHHETEGNEGYFDRLLNGPWDEPEFIRVVPGQIITDEMFA
jgi:hypothetical protein